MFIQPCFIRKNTLELREKLEELGYKYSTTGGIKSNSIVVSFGCIFDIYPIDTIKRGFNNCVDCETNEELFLALAALRNDSDYMQWFVSPKTHIHKRSGCFGQIFWMDGHYKEIIGYEWHRHENKDNALTERLNAMIQMGVEDMEFLPHKATVKEIIEHFKNK